MPFLIWTPFLYLYLASLLLLPVVITMKKRPANAVAWLLTIIFLPVFGAILFLIFGTNRVVSKAQKKLLTKTFTKQKNTTKTTTRKIL